MSLTLNVVCAICSSELTTYTQVSIPENLTTHIHPCNVCYSKMLREKERIIMQLLETCDGLQNTLYNLQPITEEAL